MSAGEAGVASVGAGMSTSQAGVVVASSSGRGCGMGVCGVALRVNDLVDNLLDFLHYD